MSERRRALSGLAATSHAGGLDRLSEAATGSIVEIAAWPDTLTTVQAASAVLLGVEMPRVGMATGDANLTVAAIDVGRFLVMSSEADLAARFEAALAAADGAVSDLSHGRSALRLEGDAAVEILAKGMAIDLDPTAFPPSRVVQTMIHHVDVTVHRRGVDAFDLVVLRGFAEFFAEWILIAGEEFGLGLQSRS
jgi:sarcosine oxidase subunit gamma